MSIAIFSHSSRVIEAVREIKRRHPETQVIAGNVLKALGAIDELMKDLPGDEREVYELAAAELEDKARVTSITAASIIAGRDTGLGQFGESDALLTPAA